MTLALFVLIQYRSVTDGQTDGHLLYALAIPASAWLAVATALVNRQSRANVTWA